MDQRISIGFSCAVLAIVTAQGCIESSCEEKRTCGGSPAPVEAAGIGGNLGLLPRATGGRAGSVSFGEGGKDDATGGAMAEAGSGGDDAEPAMGGGGSGGEPSTPAGGEPGIETDACTPSPCAHGTCAPLGASFECACEAGYSGDLCDKNIDDCTPNPCRNGGRCDDGIDEYSCVCPGQYTGTNCELPRFEIIEPTLPVYRTFMQGASADGRTVAGLFILPDQESERPFVWKDGVLDMLAIPEGFTNAWVDVVSGDGTTLFGALGYRDTEASSQWRYLPARWRDGKPSLMPIPDTWSSAAVFASSRDGSVAVGRTYVGAKSAAIVWSGGPATFLELDSTESYANGVSADGRVLVGMLSRSGKGYAFQWRDGQLELLSLPPASDSCGPNGVSADGATTFGACWLTEGPKMVNLLWANGGITQIEPPSPNLLQNPEIQLDVVSASGEAAAGYARDVSVEGEYLELPIVWTREQGMRWMVPILEEQGVDLSSHSWLPPAGASGISDDGKIVVGNVLDKNQVVRGFIARLP